MAAQFKIRDAQPWDCGALMRRLRTEHARAGVKLGYSYGHRELRDCYDNSSFRRSWIVNDRLMGVGGVTESLLSSWGMVWLALSQEVAAYPVEVVKEAKRQLAEILQLKRQIFTLILVDDLTSMRFAEFLGFEPTGNMPVVGAVHYKLEA